jgi:serpin B
MGITSLFQAADLSGMSKEADLFVSQIFQKSMIEVNEQGSEAAVTAAAAIGSRSAVPITVEFKCDRPFLFFLQEKTTGIILFSGRMFDPTKSNSSN